jgi:hypothetical protein
MKVGAGQTTTADMLTRRTRQKGAGGRERRPVIPVLIAHGVMKEMQKEQYIVVEGWQDENW